MARRPKTLLAIISAGLILYLVSLGNVSAVAEVGSAKAEEHPEGATISLEACVVRVGVETLGQGVGSADFPALSSIQAETILGRVTAGDAEVVSGVTLLVASGGIGEITAEDDSAEMEKDAEQEAGEHVKMHSSVAFHAEAQVRPAGQIAVKFSFKQVLVDNSSSGSDEGEREEEAAQVFEVSSMVGLHAGRPSVAGARRTGDEAMFLILHADI